MITGLLLTLIVVHVVLRFTYAFWVEQLFKHLKRREPLMWEALGQPWFYLWESLRWNTRFQNIIKARSTWIRSAETARLCRTVRRFQSASQTTQALLPVALVVFIWQQAP